MSALVTQTEPATRVVLIRREEQSRFERHLFPGTVGIWLTALLMATAVHSAAPALSQRAWIWAGIFTLLMLLTVLGWAFYGRRSLCMDMRDRVHLAVVLINGLPWLVAPVIFYAPETVGPGQQALVTMFLVCMVSGSSAAAVPIFGTRPHLYLTMFIPIFSAQILVFGCHGLRFSDGFHGLMALAMLLLLTVNVMFSRFTGATFRQSIELAYDNEELVRQLKVQALELSEQTRTAQQANIDKTKFLAAASHDLRQPVHALNLFVEVLSGTELSSTQKNMVQHIRAASQASGEMLNALLDYSRIEAGVMVAKPKAVQLSELFRTLEDEFGPQASNKRLAYRTRDTHVVAWCDPVMTQLVLRNFVSNALRHTSTGGVLIAARKRETQVIVQVIDTGVGIAREHWDDIFKEFLQLGNEERDRQKGLGLGLAIAKGLAQNMGARIEVNSKLGHGSVFTLYLPFARDAVGVSGREDVGEGSLLNAVPMPARDRDLSDSQAVPALSRPIQRLQGMCVLVVDDEEPVRQSMQALLDSWGCHSRSAENLEQAHELLKTGFMPHLLLTDYRLRGGSTGGQVMRSLRQLIPALQAIIITGDTAPERIREAASHAATLLHKPVQPLILQQAIVELAG